MTLQGRLKRVMKRRGERVADLARHFGVPYTTVREWVLTGRTPSIALRPRVEQLLSRLENSR